MFMSPETVATIVFGILAILGTMTTAWQGHRLWKLWRQRYQQRSSNPISAPGILEVHFDGSMLDAKSMSQTTSNSRRSMNQGHRALILQTYHFCQRHPE